MNPVNSSQYSFKQTIEDKYYLSYFVSHSNNNELTCFYTESQNYLVGELYSTFDIPSLLNRLSLATNTVDQGLFNYLSKEKENISFIIHWDEFIKKVVLLSPKDINSYQFESKDISLIQRDFHHKYFKRGFL